jgi:hypothetical protein
LTIYIFLIMAASGWIEVFRCIFSVYLERKWLKITS